MNIIAFGDIHQRVSILNLISDEIAGADAVIITGDLTQYGGVREAREIIEELQGLNPRIFAQAGNLDHPEVEGYLAGLGISIHGRGHRVGHVGIFGCGGGTPSPFNTPNELSEEEIGAVIKRAYDDVKEAPFKIMVPHAPPYNSRVDLTGSGLHVGSREIRAFIEEYQPDLCLCGHIHEATGEDFIGVTHVINAGPFSEGGYAFINAELGAELRFIV
jgi:Icc-related predicted phosphoesterase